MPPIELTGAYDQGDDVLRVEGTIDGEPAVAYGWVSATTNHYPAGAYDADGNLRDDATAKKMTRAELRAYATGLLEGVVPPTVEAKGMPLL